MSTDTRPPREPDGRFAERPDVGLARRLTERLRAHLGHDGTDAQPAPDDLDARIADQAEHAPTVVVGQDPELGPDVEAMIARQTAMLDAAVSTEPAGELVGAGKGIDMDDLDEVLARQAAIEEKMSAAQRRAKPTMPGTDGSFPIGNVADLDNAISSYGRAADKDKARAWIIRRARELDAISHLPESWGVTKDLDADVEDESLFPDESKIRRWDPDMHPRDGRGRFATIGSTVSLPESAGGGEGSVIRATGGGNILVRKPDGHEVTVPAKDTTVTRSAAANAAHASFVHAAGEGGFSHTAADAAAPTRAATPDVAPSVGKTDPDTGLPLTGPGSFERIAPVETLKPGDLIADPKDKSKPPRILTVTANEHVPGSDLTRGTGHHNVSVEGEDRPRRFLDGSRLRVVKPGAPTNAPDGAAAPSHADGSRVTRPDGSIGTVVATGVNGVGVRGADGKLTVHPAADLTPAAADTPNAGPTNAAALKEGDVVSFSDPTALGGGTQGNATGKPRHVTGTVDKVTVNGKTVTVTVDGVDHKMPADAQVHVDGPAPDRRVNQHEASRTPSAGNPANTAAPKAPNALAATNADVLKAEALSDSELGKVVVSPALPQSTPSWQAAIHQEVARRMQERQALADQQNAAADAHRAEQLANIDMTGLSPEDQAAIRRLLGPGGTDDGNAPDRPDVPVPPAAQAAIGHLPVGAGRPRPPATGTKEDPIAVGGDLDAAVKHLAEGLHVRLDQPDEVSTLLDKLIEFVQQAKADGKDAPNFDLCGVTVPGTNLFCTESKGVPRAQMPQLSGTPVPGSAAAAKMKPGDTEANVTDEFRAALEARGVKVTRRTVPASHLRATQTELDGPKVAGMSKAMEAGHVPDAGIFTTRDGYIVDGHHRWASKVAIDLKDNHLGDVSMPIDELDMDIGAAIDFANEFAVAMGIRPKSLGAAAEGVVGTGETQVAPGQVVSTPTKTIVGSCLVWSEDLREQVALQTKAAEALLAARTKSWGELALEELHRSPVYPAIEAVLDRKAQGGADRNRGNAERLRRYWTHGAGAAEIRWGTPGDHDRCVRLVVEHAHFRPDQAHGYCNLREKEATGEYPAQHAARTRALAKSLGVPVILLDELVPEVKADAPPASTDGGAVPNENPAPNGVMVAMYPPDDLAQALHLDADGAEDASSLHVTLAYLGNVDEVGMDRVGDLVNLVSTFADESIDVAAEVAGIGRWSAGQDGDAFVALIDAPELPDLRADLVDALEADGFPVRADHGFTPHVTLAYLDPSAPSPLERLEALPGTFGFLSVAFGPDVWDFPLNADAADGSAADAAPAVSAGTAPDPAVSADTPPAAPDAAAPPP